MDVLELVLVLMICIIIAAVLDRVMHKLALPLVQILAGFICALIVPQVAQIEVDPELFLVLFIAPLLFNEAREASRAELWDKKWDILSMAIGLVLLTVLVVGFALNWLVPSIPLAAAFACAGALAPTDAAAVGALGSTVKLSKRQETMLSGESLINDASGVVSFDFAIAAAVTGTFSAADAGAEFAVLFFGGIAVGIMAGLLLMSMMWLVKSRGFEDTVVNVLYEVLTPFVVYLAAEALGVSGILAVVACGLIMARHRSTLISTTEARNRMVSNAFWEVLVYLINGTVFVLLGMQLIQAFSPTLQESIPLPFILLVIVCITALVIAVRFVWVGLLDLINTDPDTGERGFAHVGRTLHDSLVTTIAGPKGAVTLSIIFTIPTTVADGSPFPERDLIIFLTAGAILLTLLLADFVLPVLSPKEDEGTNEEKVREATIEVLNGTIAELQEKINEKTKPEYEPATRMTIRAYRIRLAQERLQQEGYGDIMSQLMDEIADVQQARADEIQCDGLEGYTITDAAAYYAALRSIRGSIGYSGSNQKVGSRGLGIRGAIQMARWRIPALRPKHDDNTQIYYETCLFALELEKAAVDYLTQVIAEDGTSQRAQVAQVMSNSHELSMRSIEQRLEYGRDASDAMREEPEAAQRHFKQQFEEARQHADAVNSGALSIELQQINRLAVDGTINQATAQELRENVYVLQMNLTI
jgi:Na+/H+ antiporter